MSQILSHPIDSTSPSQVSFSYTVDNTFTKYVFEIRPIPSEDSRKALKKSSTRQKGFNRQFKPKLHNTVPELSDLTEADLEALIGERNRDDFDAG